MEREIVLANQRLKYVLKTSQRARRLRLAVYSSGDLVATRPRFLNISQVEKFIETKQEWIISKIIEFKKRRPPAPAALTRRNYYNDRERARQLAIERVQFFNKNYHFNYGRISVRNQKTRWGSCSRQGNLNFNFRLLYLAPEMRDYIIIHELCHVREFNHSPRFWRLVAISCPDYKLIRARLKNNFSL